MPVRSRLGGNEAVSRGGKSAVLALLFISTAAMAFAGGAKAAPSTPRVLPADQTQTELKAFLRAAAPPFIQPTDRERWLREAADLRGRVLDEVVFRGVPKSWVTARPKVVWGDTITAEGYFIRKLRFEAVPGLWVGGLLYEPVNLKGRVPAVLNVNGHVGKPGMTVDYKQARCINEVKRGMLALNLEWIGMGQLMGPGYAHADLAYLDFCGRAGLSVFYLELKRGLDVLLAHKNTDPERLVVTGLSGGGWQTIVISALDPRVKLSAPNAGYIGIGPRIDFRADTGDLEQNANDLVSVADYTYLTALLAPRPALLIYNAKDDCCFPAARALESVFKPIVPVYGLFDKTGLFANHVNNDPGTHNYLKDNREAFYRFLNRQFVPREKWIDEDVPVTNEIRSSEALAVQYPADNASFHTLAAELMKTLPAQTCPKRGEAAIERWRGETRAKLRDIVKPESDLAVDPNPARVAAFKDSVAGVAGTARLLRLRGQWTLPCVEYVRPGSAPEATALIVCDRGLADARELVADALSRGERAVAVDLLFTGECQPTDRQAWSFAQLIATVGRRPLGVQAGQLEAVIKWLRVAAPGKPLRVAAKGRVAGLAALVAAALDPQCVDRLELRETPASLKNLVTDKIGYLQAPSLFCFGLLEIADIPELKKLAEPTRTD